MVSPNKLKDRLERIHGKGYKAYKEIQGNYDFSGFQLFIDHVQGDPFAAPSRIRVRVDRHRSGFSEDTTSSPSRTIALRDFLTRQFYQNCVNISLGNRGIGKSGLIAIDRPGQEILDRSAMVISPGFIEARFVMGLPAFGRKIAGKDARAMFFEELAEIVDLSLFTKGMTQKEVQRHIECSEDADFLRTALDRLGMIAFVGEGALLPRASGIDPAPLEKERSILFTPPERYALSIHLPNRGKVTGMGIPKGVTLIVGGGFHGKSTLLNALELGIYNHIPGDGRELAVTVENAVKIRAADGRSIKSTDISPFINNLPLEKDTREFSTQNASGSTSQAAGISEAVEAGATALLMDEDTSATNFMIRDLRMQKLVAKTHEPITPFIDKVTHLYNEKGVSSVLVMGGSGDYFSVADHVIQMTWYQPYDVTEKARSIAGEVREKRIEEGGERFGNINPRVPHAGGISPFVGKRKLKIAARGRREILFGPDVIDCWDVEQVVDISQTRAIGYAIHYAARYMDGRRPMKDVLTLVMADLDQKGLDILPPWCTGDLARFRIFELAAAINRMRTIQVKQQV